MKSIIFTILASLISLISISQTISEIQGDTDESPYIGQSVVTGGIVTGIGVDGYFIQDAVGAWNGIYVYDQSQTPAIGDDISFSADVDEFFNFTELVNVTDFEVLSSGNPLPAPIILATSETMDESLEGVRVRVENATCTNNDLGFGEFELNDGSGPCVVNDLLYLYSATEGVTYNVTGPISFGFGQYKIEPTSIDDVEIADPLYFTMLPEEFDLETNSLTINWETNAPSNSVLDYGLTENYELGTIEIADLETSHSIVLSDLSPATIYYVKAQSSDSENSTSEETRVVCTKSESSGDYLVLFTQPTDPTVSTGVEAEFTSDIADSLAHYISQAEQTLDIMMYDVIDSDPILFEAINSVYDQGVQVRFITDDDIDVSEYDALNSDIPVLFGNSEGIMHDKVLIIDVENTMNSWVYTGSVNWTPANLGWDYNNLIGFQDQSLARCYTQEFNEMWGSEGADFDESESLFGSEKMDNTPHKFEIGGIDVECYFSPSDDATGQIREAIENTETEIAFSVMVFTENSLGNAMVEAHENGINVQGMIDYVEFNGSEFDYLLDNGLPVIDYQNEDGTQWPDGPVMHHKYCIMDYSSGNATPLLITGSHNWSASAESINDENTLLIFDHTIANLYYQEFFYLFYTVDIEESANAKTLILSPNPANTSLTINRLQNGQISIYDTAGKLVYRQKVTNQSVELDVTEWHAGMYVVILSDEKNQVIEHQKLMIH